MTHRGASDGQSDGRTVRDAAFGVMRRFGLTTIFGNPDHVLSAGYLPWRRRLMRETLAAHDVVVAIGTGAFRLYLIDAYGPPVEPGTRVAVITDDPEEAHRSRGEVALVASVAEACRALAGQVSQRDGAGPAPVEPPPAPTPPGGDEPLRAGARAGRARVPDAAGRGTGGGDSVEPAGAVPADSDPRAAWPAFDAIDIAGVARCLGCPSRRVSAHEELVGTLDEMMPDLGSRREPLLVEVALAPDGQMPAANR
jgi:thiamine pyrophosphate-dependent acetolactate synthase large subunit-like protein